MELTPRKLSSAIEAAIKAQQPIMITAPPGVGKSQIVAQTTRKMGADWGFIDCRLSIRDAVDLRGVPFVKDGKTFWASPAELPTSGKGVLFLDEINAAPPQVQVAAYQLVLDRKIGEYTLPEGWAVIAAGNGEGDGAVVHKMSSALNSRFIHVELKVSKDDWYAWAVSANIEPVVLGFIRMFPDKLHAFNKSQKTFPCPRTWEFVSKIVALDITDKDVEHALIAGAVGEGAAIEFAGFLRLFRELPSIDGIMMDPMGSMLPKTPGAMVACAHALARCVTKVNAANVFKYLGRLPSEYTTMAVRDSAVRNPEVTLTKEYAAWMVKNGQMLAAA